MTHLHHLALPLALLLAGPVAAGAPPAPAKAETAGLKPTPAQQDVLDRIRQQRDSQTRRFGDCTYRWNEWRLGPNGVRTTRYSCDRSEVVDHTVGVSCSKLKINFYQPITPLGQEPERWAWGQWRLPEAGPEEQLVATLCANALPGPAPAPRAEAKP